MEERKVLENLNGISTLKRNGIGVVGDGKLLEWSSYETS